MEVHKLGMGVESSDLDRFGELSKEHHFQVALVFLPGMADTPADRVRRSQVKEYASLRNTPFLDLSEAIHAMGRRAFIVGNPHFSPAGHQVVAMELDRFLTGGRLLSP